MRSVKQEEEDSILFQAYKITVKEFEKELENTKWYEFRYRKFLNNQISTYKELIRQLDLDMLLKI